ncbi:GNAT family N-acetyltransferase [Nocardia callitridis]|uniref:GNAT family N-acetyltransferase n=1 Tax=Nocardia callitridis TaxID=648753 RepID=A0ABP9KC34_9NOCA
MTRTNELAEEDQAQSRIAVDDVTDPRVVALLTEHLAQMHEHSPADSVHALGLESLRRPEVTVWVAWEGGQPAGCAALLRLDEHHGEIKSMRTAEGYLRRGIAARLLRRLLDEGAERGYRRLSLETGSAEYFLPAQRLYAANGFGFCAPFGAYRPDPFSVFMTRTL